VQCETDRIPELSKLTAILPVHEKKRFTTSGIQEVAAAPLTTVSLHNGQTVHYH